jgi:SpoVK/Ycf46/Vps4 family AAA+-type ATPase
MSEALAGLARSVRAGARGLILRGDDEARAVRLLEDLGGRLGWPVHTWSVAGGANGSGAPTPLPALLHDLAARREPGLWLLLDPPPDPLAARALRELAQRGPAGPVAVLIGEPAPVFAQIPELADHALPRPELGELVELADAEAAALRRAGHVAAADTLTRAAARAVQTTELSARTAPTGMSPGTGDMSQTPGQSDLPAGTGELPPSTGAHSLDTTPAPDLVRLALGLSEHAARRLLRDAALTGAGDDRRAAARLAAGKAEALHRGALLEPVEAVPEDMLGGLPVLKAWLRRRALALHPSARAAAIADPRGVLLVGVQGCGKSLAARVCARLLGVGLVRLEPGRLFGGTVGESEANLRRVTDAAERLAPVALWIDELDKGLAGSEGAASDAGTAARVLGGLLTWLQERARPVFVVATANRVDALPPELLRRGRLDEIFFVDLPGPDERAAIAEIHLVTAPQRRLGLAPPLADPLPAFLAAARAADGLSGAEIEGAVTEARLDAFAEARPLAATDLARALSATIPVSRSRAAEVAALRAWAGDFARRA